jgi:hypothetical protein
MGRYSQALERYGLGPADRRFYDVRVNVDTSRAEIARDRLVTGLMVTEPHLGVDLLFGATCLLMLEQRFSAYLLDAWSEDRSSLIPWEMTAP